MSARTSIRLLIGDCRDVLKTLPDESVNCVVTSPPYFGLRDYGTATWQGGDPDCDHLMPVSDVAKSTLGIKGHGNSVEARTRSTERQRKPYNNQCGKCGGVRVDSQIGLEPTPQEFVAEMVSVFREIRRVLTKDGTCWLNLGDSYASSGGKGTPGKTTQRQGRTRPQENIQPWRDGSARADGIVSDDGTSRRNRNGTIAVGYKPKDLIGIPWRVAIALQDDGWWLRQDIIWHKPNPMPESITDRCTKAHEYVFMLTKSAKYWYDADAIAEEGKDWSVGGPGTGIKTTEHYGAGNGGNGGLASLAARYKGRKAGNKSHKYVDAYEGSDTEEHRTKAGLMNVADVEWNKRNKRSVWTISNKPFSQAHFATFPIELPETCIKAGCPVGGIVLDPFFGAGTTGLAAFNVGRSCIGIELSEKYALMATKRYRKHAGIWAKIEGGKR